MYQRCSRQNDQESDERRNNQEENEEESKYEIKESINSSINNRGFLVQIGAIIIFDDFNDTDSDLTTLAGTTVRPFEIKFDKAGSLSINGKRLDVESLNKETNAVVIKNGTVTTV